MSFASVVLNTVANLERRGENVWMSINNLLLVAPLLDYTAVAWKPG